MNFPEKSENVTLLHSLILSYMQKIRKIYRAVFRENRGRQTERKTDRERETERDGPKFKGPPDAITKPSDQKVDFWPKWQFFDIFWPNMANLGFFFPKSAWNIFLHSQTPI